MDKQSNNQDGDDDGRAVWALKERFEDQQGKEKTIPEETQSQLKGMQTVKVPVDGLSLSQDVLQFKTGANQEGVVDSLGGKFDRTDVGPIIVRERRAGRKEVISGRHRFDLAKRSGE